MPQYGLGLGTFCQVLAGLHVGIYGDKRHNLRQILLGDDIDDEYELHGGLSRAIPSGKGHKLGISLAATSCTST
jgi:hypothetical protein